jgi:GNAT superfamily N-acetyltransferase
MPYDVHYDAATLERTAKTFRSDMWQTVCDDAVTECGIAEARFGPVQVNVFEALPDDPSLNLILGAAEPGTVGNGHLANAIAWADEFDVAYRVAVARDRPGTTEAERYLNRLGFEQGRGIWKYTRDTSWPSLSGNPAITVWEIAEEAAGETMVVDAAPVVGFPSQAASLLFALPIQERWRTYTAELEEKIVSFGSMLIDGGVAHIGLDGTVPEYRGRGCNQVLLRRRIVDAREAGCQTIFAQLEEGEAEGIAVGGRNLLRAGFIPAYRSMHWQRPR